MFIKTGEMAALVTAFSWTAAAMIFERASSRAGVTAVNTLKVLFGTIYLSILAFFFNGEIIPADLPARSWIFMSASGVVGFVIGDFFLFNSYLLVGSRIAMLLMAASVPITAVASFFIFGETLGTLGVLGIAGTIFGIGLTVVSGNRSFELNEKSDEDESGSNEFYKSDYVKGIVFGAMSAVSMAAGTLLTKIGAADISAIAATQVRIFSALVGFVFIVILFSKSEEVFSAVKNPKSFSLIAVGSVFGPFIGVGALLYAIQHAEAGVVATISSLTPVLIIAPSIIIFKKRISLLEIAGAFIAVGSVSLLFMH